MVVPPGIDRSFPRILRLLLHSSGVCACVFVPPGIDSSYSNAVNVVGFAYVVLLGSGVQHIGFCYRSLFWFCWYRLRQCYFRCACDATISNMLTPSAAELAKRRFHTPMAWLPAPTVSLRPPVAVSAGIVAKYFSGCPDNAFQVALASTSYSFLQTIGAIVPNGAKVFAVGTGASLFFEMPRHEAIKALDTYKRAGQQIITKT
ncbi:hypothetical protein L2E82_32823 [Cichorium intybus]|uniref:Uncharacterized protein n=1 Tax=Cichorium intybus TaxID=13427 RepID=A0ACB9BHU9_CICIN|nr:hypothetical protein L2E82_32823 [Cichorium intybus]